MQYNRNMVPYRQLLLLQCDVWSSRDGGHFSRCMPWLTMVNEDFCSDLEGGWSEQQCSSGGSTAPKVNQQVRDLFRLVDRDGVTTLLNDVHTPAAGNQLPQHLRTRAVDHLTQTHTDRIAYFDSINDK